MTIECILTTHEELPEGPIWSVEENVLYWLSCVKNPSINRFNPKTGKNTFVKVSQIITSMVLREDGGMLVTVEDGYAFTDFANGKLNIIHNPYPEKDVIFNDGACDRKGRFWSGTADYKEWKNPIGSLFRLDPDHSVHVMDKNIILANGIGFSPDNKKMYFTDFGRRTIFSYDFDLETGNIAKQRALIIVPENEGSPDGMTVDVEGFLWVAHWDGWRITRYTPQGKVAEVISMPVQCPTSVAFGGDDLSELYITSARMGLNEEEIKKSPLSGSLFKLQTSTKGLPEPKFAG
jgi:sugar lactone lactonase YvrE